MKHCKNCNISFSDNFGGCPSCRQSFTDEKPSIVLKSGSSTSITNCPHKNVGFARDYDDPHYYCGDCGMRLGEELADPPHKAGEVPHTVSGVFQTKDSGKRQEFETGMVRDTQDDKPRYDLVWKPGLKRLAELYARGSVKYSERNWMKAETQQELDRFVSSANRHFEQWVLGDRTEDHMAGTIFNLFGAEYVFNKMRSEGKNPHWIYGE